MSSRKSWSKSYLQCISLANNVQSATSRVCAPCGHIEGGSMRVLCAQVLRGSLWVHKAILGLRPSMRLCEWILGPFYNEFIERIKEGPERSPVSNVCGVCECWSICRSTRPPAWRCIGVSTQVLQRAGEAVLFACAGPRASRVFARAPSSPCLTASSATRPRLVGSGSLMSDGNPSSQSKKRN